MKIYISTANQYLPLLKAFSYLFNLFWSPIQEVNILGYNKPDFILPNNFVFISMGEQSGRQTWSTDLRKFFESIDDDFFIWLTEDQFLVKPVNFKIYNYIIGTYLTNDLGRFGLTNDNQLRPFDFYSRQDGYDIIENHQNVEYRLSVMWSIWNKKYLLRYLKDGWAPWEFEVHGSAMAKNDKFKILGTFGDYAVRPCQAIRKGNHGVPLNFNLINENTALSQIIINDMKRMGIINEENRIN